MHVNLSLDKMESLFFVYMYSDTCSDVLREPGTGFLRFLSLGTPPLLLLRPWWCSTKRLIIVWRLWRSSVLSWKVVAVTSTWDGIWFAPACVKFLLCFDCFLLLELLTWQVRSLHLRICCSDLMIPLLVLVSELPCIGKVLAVCAHGVVKGLLVLCIWFRFSYSILVTSLQWLLRIIPARFERFGEEKSVPLTFLWMSTEASCNSGLAVAGCKLQTFFLFGYCRSTGHRQKGCCSMSLGWGFFHSSSPPRFAANRENCQLLSPSCYTVHISWPSCCRIVLCQSWSACRRSASFHLFSLDFCIRCLHVGCNHLRELLHSSLGSCEAQELSLLTLGQ